MSNVPPSRFWRQAKALTPALLAEWHWRAVAASLRAPVGPLAGIARGSLARSRPREGLALRPLLLRHRPRLLPVNLRSSVAEEIYKIYSGLVNCECLKEIYLGNLTVEEEQGNLTVEEGKRLPSLTLLSRVFINKHLLINCLRRVCKLDFSSCSPLEMGNTATSFVSLLLFINWIERMKHRETNSVY